MVKHICTKEVEIAEMYKDIKYIRKALEGNGHKGLIEQVSDNTKFIYTVIGGLTVLSIALSYVITVIF